MFCYRGRAVWTEIRISFFLSWMEAVWPKLIVFFEVTPLFSHGVSRHVSLFQQVVAWSLLIAERFYVNFAESHNRIAFIIYLLTLSWICLPRKATKNRSDHSISTWKSWLDQSPVSRRISWKVGILILVYDSGFIRFVFFTSAGSGTQAVRIWRQILTFCFELGQIRRRVLWVVNNYGCSPGSFL